MKQSNILEKKERKRKYARERAKRLREDPAYRQLELERTARWRQGNPDKLKESRSKSHRQWYLEHKDEKLSQNKKWKEDHPERLNEMSRERRAMKKGARVGERSEVYYFEELLRRDPCSYCGKKCEHIDHIYPLSGGGEHDWSNLTASCARCNLVKHTKPLLEFLLCA